MGSKIARWSKSINATVKIVGMGGGGKMQKVKKKKARSN